MRKNVASQVISAQLISKTDGSDVTSGSTTVYVTGDGGTQGSGGGTVTHEGNGTWSYVPTQAETNYTHISFTFVNATAVSAIVNVYTVGQDFTAAQLAGNVTQWSGTNVASPDTAGYPKVTVKGGTGTGELSLAAGAVTVGTNNDKTNYELSAAALTAIHNELLLLSDSLNAPATTATTVELNGSNAANDGAYIGCLFVHMDSTGLLIQTRVITDFDLSTSIITVDRAWTVTPVDTDRYWILGTAILDTHAVRIVKNTALSNFEFPMYDATTHLGSTGLTVTAQRSIDGAAFAACSNSPVEVSNGIYKINLTAADLNGDTITLRFSATGAEDTIVSIITQVV